MKIIELHVSNVKRLRAVSITPQGNTVVIGGANEQGKSSVLDAILMALAGRDAICEKPIREGQTKAEVTVDLGDLVVTRKFSATGTALVVKSKDDKNVASPQTLLDNLVGAVGFDPLAFSRMDSRAQRECLAKLARLDLSSIDKAYAQLYEQRRDANREVDRLNHQLAGRISVGPYEEISTVELLNKLNEVEAKNRSKAGADLAVDQAQRDVNNATKYVANQVAEVERLRAQVSAAESALENGKLLLRDRHAALDKLTEVAKEFPAVDTATIKVEIANAAEQNAKIRENVTIKALQEEFHAAQTRASSYEAQCRANRDERAEKIANAAYPLPGLAVTDDCVLFNSIPLKQASTAQQIKISAAIGIALKPKLRVMLIRDGAFLDDANLAALREMAENNDVQLWIERVGKGQECSIVIEDGAIAEDRTADDHI